MELAFNILSNMRSEVISMRLTFQKRFSLIVLLIAVFTGLFCNEVLSLENEKIIITAHPEFPPIMYKNGDKIDGVGPELAEIILKKIGAEITLKKIGIEFDNKYVGPWARVLLSVKKGEIDLIAGLYKTKEREAFLDYIPTPFMTNPAVIFVKKGKAFPFKKWEELKGRTGGGIIGDKFEPTFDEFLLKNNDTIKIERVTSIVQNFKKLIIGRIDFISYSKYVGLLVSKEMGIENQIELLPEPIYSGLFYLAIAKESRLTKYIPEINKKIIEYKDDGTVESLINKHITAYAILKKRTT